MHPPPVPYGIPKHIAALFDELVKTNSTLTAKKLLFCVTTKRKEGKYFSTAYHFINTKLNYVFISKHKF